MQNHMQTNLGSNSASLLLLETLAPKLVAFRLQMTLSKGHLYHFSQAFTP